MFLTYLFISGLLLFPALANSDQDNKIHCQITDFITSGPDHLT